LNSWIKEPAPTARQVLLHMAVMALLSGPLLLACATLEKHGLDLMAMLLSLAFSFYPFLWYCRDRDARGYPRSRWLNMAMVALTMFALPYYLVRSRAGAGRIVVLFKLAGYCVALLVLFMMGMFVALPFVPR
jgi:hypothetical protein